ncbi:mono-functional DNA-alkylating methyl methanesulfonate N-term-domain-containing protein [Cyathus striatus]|nr:mono-functional DNA-alkylating methyl methanesulfonate N-term-domain-containing protein [Cyathus striatus]
MHLYNLTLQPPTASLQAIVGNFSGARQQEIIISRGTRLELLRPDPTTGKVSTVIATDVFGSIRSLATFRLTGGTKGQVGVYPESRCCANLTISSPLEAHKTNAIIHHIIGLDVGFENPMFAALEVDYTESDQDPTGEAFNSAEKMLTYYELDLGLNHVVRKWSEPTDPRANLLVQVPGGQLASSERFDGPSGVLVCCEDHIIYRHMDQPQHRVPIPRRRHPLSDPDRGLIITAAVMHKMKGAFFFLLQSEEGDLYKVTIDHEEEEVKALKIKYFDTVPVASSLCILKSGFLFVASEFGNHYLYQFQKLVPRPIIDSKVLNLLPNSDTPQIFTACGRGARSTLRTLRHGLEVEESVSSDLPGIPNAVWTTKRTEDDPYDSYIILSFVNGTLVLSIGETIEEVQDTGFLSSAPTLAVQQIGADALLQVHPHGIRHVLSDRRVNEWRVPQGKTIVAATTNKRQVVVALSSAELVYFELDLDGQLNEYQDRKAMGSTVLALSIAEVPEGRQRTPFLAVGCEDQTVRIISLDPESTLETISLQALTAPPSAICIADMLDASINKSHPTLFVNIGLQNGVLLRTVLDPINGQLTDTRTRYILGNTSHQAHSVQIQKNPAILALSSRSWLNYTHQNLMHFTPLIYENLDYAWSFSAELSPEGLIGIAGSVLRIFGIPKLGMKLKQDSMPLSYTPRKFITHPDPSNSYFYMIESDHRVMSEDAATKKLNELRNQGKNIDDEMVNLPPEVFGRPKAAAGTWGSCLRIIDPVKRETVALYPLEDSEAAFSIAVWFLRVYKFLEDGAGLELVHKTEIDDVPLSLMAFQGRLVAGVGKALRIYDMGKKKMLRKVENKTFSSPIVTLNTQGSRILADDSQPRWVSAAAMVDYNTVVVGDRFGNVFVNRLDPKVSDQVDDDPTGAGILHEKGILMGAPHKTKMIAHFHVGFLVPGGREVLLYTGIHGTIGILVPFVSKEDVDFISTLEQHMLGRDQLSWRGYYAPVKGVSGIAGELDRTVGEVLKKLEQLRVTASGF